MRVASSPALAGRSRPSSTASAGGERISTTSDDCAYQNVSTGQSQTRSRRTVLPSGLAEIPVSRVVGTLRKTTDVSIDIPPLLPGGGGASDEVRESSSWWDPLVGVRVRWRISERALLTAHVNAGGFGWGEASDSVWDLGLVLSIRVWKGLSIPLGYRVLTYERSDDGLDLDTTMQGPIVGVSFTF